MTYNLIIKCYFYFFIVLGVILFLRKMFGSNNFFNKIVNLAVYIFEFFTFGVLFNLVVDNMNFQSSKSILFILKAFIFSNTIYQIVLYMILKFWDGTTIDSYNSIIVYLKKCIIISEDKESLQSFLDYSNTKFTHLDKIGSYNKCAKSFRMEIEKINESFLRNEMDQKTYKNAMKFIQIEIENELSIISFGWQSSILLRMIK